MFGRNDTDGWTQVAIRYQNTSFTQNGLSAGINYYFVVRAENSHGISMPSQMSEPVILGMVSEHYMLLCSTYIFIKYISKVICAPKGFINVLKYLYTHSMGKII